MSQNLCAKTCKLRPALFRISLLGAFVLATVAIFGNTGCEDKAIGRPCDVLTAALPEQGVYNPQALDCPTRICVKPAVSTDGHSPTVDPLTTAYCSASCSQDSDCDGQTRDKGAVNGSDTRCVNGYTCAIPFDKGSLCCQKLCLCKDFVSLATGAVVPDACNGVQAATCNQVSH
jgi:hypothetical protein